MAMSVLIARTASIRVSQKMVWLQQVFNDTFALCYRRRHSFQLEYICNGSKPDTHEKNNVVCVSSGLLLATSGTNDGFGTLGVQTPDVF